MKKQVRFVVFLFTLCLFFAGCEMIKHGKEAVLGSYTTEIDYTNSVIELAVDLNMDGDNDMTTNPPVFTPLDSTAEISFIEAYFIESSASVLDIGGDSVKYTDTKRTLHGCIKGDSIIFQSSDLGPSPVMAGVIVDSTILYTKAKTISNDLHMTYSFSGTGSVVFSPTVTKFGIVKGTVKVIARK